MVHDPTFFVVSSNYLIDLRSRFFHSTFDIEYFDHNMIKSGINYLEIEKGFIRKCLTNVGIRLDGRRATDFLPVTINISRSESKSIGMNYFHSNCS